MNSKRVIAISATVILFLFVICWFLFSTNLSRYDADEVLYIDITDGRSGERFTVPDRESINEIVSSVQGAVFVKILRSSNGLKGYAFSLKVIAGDGSVLDSFYIDSETSLRKDPFIYRALGGDLCFDYLTVLKNQSVQEIEGD